MPDIHNTITEGMQFWQIATAGMAFAVLFPSVSFVINRRLCDGPLKRDIHGVAQLAALVFVLAILCEAIFNPIYESFFNEKLWHYRFWPLHDGNISALSVLVWTSYGVHLYFLNQRLIVGFPRAFAVINTRRSLSVSRRRCSGRCWVTAIFC